MATVLEHEPAEAPPAGPPSTLQDLVDRLGGIPLTRIRATPPPGTATLDDLIRVNERKQGICELVDGTLVEKTVGIRESLIAGTLISLLRAFVIPRNLGLVTSPDGAIQLCPGLVRAPDVAFFAWKFVPGGRVPTDSIPELHPTLAIEVVSKGNTKSEMDRKRRECFEAGTLEFWLVDPWKATIAVYQPGNPEPRVHRRSEALECPAVLPGVRLSLDDLFGELDRVSEEPKDA
jgi:Uma2 family endonuclease